MGLLTLYTEVVIQLGSTAQCIVKLALGRMKSTRPSVGLETPCLITMIANEDDQVDNDSRFHLGPRLLGSVPQA